MSTADRPALTARRCLALVTSSLLLPLATLTGCVANSSNPLIVVESASSDEQKAIFELDIRNPGGRNLVLTELEYDVSHGESSFPVAQGSWSGMLDLPKKGRTHLTLETPFDTPPIESDSQLLHLNGELILADRTGYLGLKAMDLTRTSFRADVTSTRSRQ